MDKKIDDDDDDDDDDESGRPTRVRWYVLRNMKTNSDIW